MKMPEAQAAPTKTEFSRWVRDALNRLYDSGYLESHPLSQMLLPTESRRMRASQELRRILLATIQSMHPEKTAPDQSHDWRVYRILELRYITGLTSAEVMQRLAMGRSLFFLEQARALNALVDRLWPQALSIQQKDTLAYPRSTASNPPSAEVDRLLRDATWETVELGELLDGLRPVIEALVSSQGGQVEFQVCTAKPARHADRVLLRQVILSLVSHSMATHPGGRVEIRVEAGETPVLAIRVCRSEGVIDPRLLDTGAGVSLELCKRLVQAMEGSLQIEQLPQDCWEGRLKWNSTRPHRLMVIDDHPDLIELIRRYLTGPDWQVSGAGDSEAARKLLEGSLPDAIILDVILPKEDGWEFLLWLKTDPATRAIPVIVCSALHEPQLVTALGGSAFLPKPFNRPALFTALNQAGLGKTSLGPGQPEEAPKTG